MTVTVVTTMNRAGWKEHGGRMVESFKQRWPADVTLVVYAEGFEVADGLGVEVRVLPDWVDTFKAKFGDSRKAIGYRYGGSIYDYRFDCVKFAHKVSALTDAGKRLNDGVMIWLDADTFTHSDVTHEWLEELFPAPSYVAWLDRQNCYPECGFIMFRCAHQQHQAMMSAYEELYTSSKVFNLREWHDSFAFQHMIEKAVAAFEIEPPVSLSGDSSWHHPFVNGPLGAKMDHMKGRRKRVGRSSLFDMRRPRTEPYWQKRG